MRKLIFALAILLIAASFLAADHIYFRDGRIVHGTLLVFDSGPTRPHLCQPPEEPSWSALPAMIRGRGSWNGPRTGSSPPIAAGAFISPPIEVRTPMRAAASRFRFGVRETPMRPRTRTTATHEIPDADARVRGNRLKLLRRKLRLACRAHRAAQTPGLMCAPAIPSPSRRLEK